MRAHVLPRLARRSSAIRRFSWHGSPQVDRRHDAGGDPEQLISCERVDRSEALAEKGSDHGECGPGFGTKSAFESQDKTDHRDSDESRQAEQSARDGDLSDPAVALLLGT